LGNLFAIKDFETSEVYKTLKSTNGNWVLRSAAYSPRICS